MLFPVTPHAETAGAAPAHESRLMMETALKDENLFFSTAVTVSGQVRTRKEELLSPSAVCRGRAVI